MCGEMEVGTCDICGAKNVHLNRKYYEYSNIKCECHSPCHFEIVRYCNNCEPVEPKETRILINTSTLRKLIESINNEAQDDNTQS